MLGARRPAVAQLFVSMAIRDEIHSVLAHPPIGTNGFHEVFFSEPAGEGRFSTPPLGIASLHGSVGKPALAHTGDMSCPTPFAPEMVFQPRTDTGTFCNSPCNASRFPSRFPYPIYARLGGLAVWGQRRV